MNTRSVGNAGLWTSCNQVAAISTTSKSGAWFVIQLPWVHRILGMGNVEPIAYWAHVGGFVAGVLLGPLFCVGTPRRRG